MKFTDVGDDFENELMYACGLIIKGLYYQMFTDVFGEIPYSEAADTDIALPKFDGQKEIYQGIIADLDAAMSTIGTNVRTGDGVNDLGKNDLYCGGDPLALYKSGIEYAMMLWGVSSGDAQAFTVGITTVTPEDVAV